MRSNLCHGAISLLTIALLMAPAANAATSLEGTRGLIRIHSADPHARGTISGTLHGLYAREAFSAIESPRNSPETVKFGAGRLALSYAPTPFVELALRGTVESQFVNSEQRVAVRPLEPRREPQGAHHAAGADPVDARW